MTWEPAPLDAMALTITIPMNPGLHCAMPLASTVAPALAMQPLASLTHQVAFITRRRGRRHREAASGGELHHATGKGLRICGRRHHHDGLEQASVAHPAPTTQ